MVSLKNFCFDRQCGQYLCLLKVFRPLYILLTIIGLFPYSVKRQTIKNRFSIVKKSIYFNSICAVSYLLFICTFLAFHIRYVYLVIENSALSRDVLTQVNYIAELVGITIFCIVVYVTAFINRFKYIKILNTLASRIDAPNHNSETVLSNLRYQINVTVMGFLAFVVVLQIVVNFTRSDSLIKMFLVVITFNLPQMIQFTAIAFFYTLMMMLVGLLKNIREQTLLITNQKRIYMNGLINTESRSNITLRQVELIYIEASELKNDVNHAFEAPIMVLLMQCFHAMVSESHIIYHGVAIQNSFHVHEIVNCSLWVGYQLMKIYAITTASNAFKFEVSNLVRAINSIPTERQDFQFMMEVQHVITTLTHGSNELTVYGYFLLDTSLAFKIVASVAMYIVILVQLDKRQ